MVKVGHKKLKKSKRLPKSELKRQKSEKQGLTKIDTVESSKSEDHPPKVNRAECIDCWTIETQATSHPLHMVFKDVHCYIGG